MDEDVVDRSMTNIERYTHDPVGSSEPRPSHHQKQPTWRRRQPPCGT